MNGKIVIAYEIVKTEIKIAAITNSTMEVLIESSSSSDSKSINKYLKF